MKTRDIPYNDPLKQVTDQLPKGTFLTVKSGDTVNVMTAGWCMIGFMWNRPIFQIVVRTSRHTFDLIEQAHDFTVSFPAGCDMKTELAYCGSRSGRNVDKAAGCGLTLAPAQKVLSPVVADCNLHYECRLVAKQKLPVEQLSDSDSNHEENDGHYHVMYYGEIVACYLTEEE